MNLTTVDKKEGDAGVLARSLTSALDKDNLCEAATLPKYFESYFEKDNEPALTLEALNLHFYARILRF